MYQILKQNREKTIYFTLFTLIVTFSLLLTVVFKNDEGINSNKKIDISFQREELTSIKEFLLTLVKSPFINISVAPLLLVLQVLSLYMTKGSVIREFSVQIEYSE